MKNLRIARHLTAVLLLLAIAFMSGCATAPKGTPRMKSPYVTVQNLDGKFWFEQNGEPFLALGVNCVLPSDGSKVPDGKLYNVWDRYDGNADLWAQSAVSRLQGWNFNTVSGWSHDHLYNTQPMYHTRVLWMGAWGESGGPDMRLLDVFDPEYAAHIDQIALQGVAPHKTNKYLIGYFCNNELPWYGQYGWPGDPKVSVLTRYIQLPAEAPGKLRVLEFLKKQYNHDFAAFLKDWETKATSFEDLRSRRRMTPASKQAKKLTFEWVGIVAEEYFRICSEAIRRHDPNHLFLGCRFAGNAPLGVLQACGKYADVISLNHYRKTGQFDTRLVGAIASMSDKPVMITEFSWRAMENASGCQNAKGADVTVQTQQDRADCFQRYAEVALGEAYIVGYDWFQYFDQPPAGRFDGENSNYGLLDIYDNPYTTLLSVITEINGRAKTIHAESEQSMPAYDPTVIVDYQDIKMREAAPLPAPTMWNDGSGPIVPYGDAQNGGRVEIEGTGSSRVFHVRTGTGWGCGLSTFPISGEHPDKSKNLLGAKKIVLVASLSENCTLNMGLNESGHGPTDAQTFDGYARADGESYNHVLVAGKAGEHRYEFSLANMEHNGHHGNQRGNKTIDTDAVSELSVYFPGSQGDFDVTIQSIRIE